MLGNFRTSNDIDIISVVTYNESFDPETYTIPMTMKTAHWKKSLFLPQERSTLTEPESQKAKQ